MVINKFTVIIEQDYSIHKIVANELGFSPTRCPQYLQHAILRCGQSNSTSGLVPQPCIAVYFLLNKSWIQFLMIEVIFQFLQQHSSTEKNFDLKKRNFKLFVSWAEFQILFNYCQSLTRYPLPNKFPRKLSSSSIVFKAWLCLCVLV